MHASVQTGTSDSPWWPHSLESGTDNIPETLRIGCGKPGGKNKSPAGGPAGDLEGLWPGGDQCEVHSGSPAVWNRKSEITKLLGAPLPSDSGIEKVTSAWPGRAWTIFPPTATLNCFLPPAAP